MYVDQNGNVWQNHDTFRVTKSTCRFKGDLVKLLLIVSSIYDIQKFNNTCEAVREKIGRCKQGSVDT